MDLDSIKVLDTSRVELVHPVSREKIPDADGKPQWIEVHGADSEQYRRRMHKVRQEFLKEGGTPDEFERSERTILDTLVAVTVGWNIQLGGQPAPYSPDAARKLYKEHPWIKDQVDQHVHRRANFIMDSSKG